MTYVFRFAPSPNGRLHLGHAYSALLNAQAARQSGGRFLLRIEDIDPTRCKPEFTQHLLDDLAWLGLAWEEPVRVQSQHMADYAAALDKLKGRDLVYPCFCSRREVEEASTAHDPDGAPLYPGTCSKLLPQAAAQRIAQGAPHSWRLHMQKALLGMDGALSYKRFSPESFEEESVAADPARWGDAILARKETPTSYHLSVVVDDALQGVTHVVRGKDLEAATSIHALLQKLLGLPTPLYHHHALLLAAEGDKLSKSRDSETLADLRERGMTEAQVLAMIRSLLNPGSSA